MKRWALMMGFLAMIAALSGCADPKPVEEPATPTVTAGTVAADGTLAGLSPQERQWWEYTYDNPEGAVSMTLVVIGDPSSPRVATSAREVALDEARWNLPFVGEFTPDLAQDAGSGAPLFEFPLGAERAWEGNWGFGQWDFRVVDATASAFDIEATDQRANLRAAYTLDVARGFISTLEVTDEEGNRVWSLSAGRAGQNYQGTIVTANITSLIDASGSGGASADPSTLNISDDISELVLDYQITCVTNTVAWTIRLERPDGQVEHEDTRACPSAGEEVVLVADPAPGDWRLVRAQAFVGAGNSWNVNVETRSYHEESVG